MAKWEKPAIAMDIEQQAEEVLRLAAADQALEYERLRDETASLQAMIAEATRLQLKERRFHVRGTAVMSPVLMECEEFAGYCLISDLSPDGMKATIHAAFSRQQPTRVHFTSHETIHGWLVWSGSREVGVQFDQPIDVAKVLSSFGRLNARSGPDRHVRLPVQCLAEVSAGKHFGIHEVGDISQRGVKVLATLGKPGQKVAVQLEELEERSATVCWSRPGSAGLAFSEPLSFEELAMFG